MSGADPSGAGWSAWTGGEAAPVVEAALRGDAGRYARVALLGRGGMGEVVLARDARLRREVAVKRVAPGAPADAAALLVDEARLTAHLEHPGIVAVHDLGVDDDGAPWVALAVVRGRTLEAALAEAPSDARLGFVRPLLAVCEAVAFAHRAGVVHRDLKPANVLVGDLGEVQVADWGLAATLPGFGWEEILGERPRRAGSGTPAFMAPEQAAGAAPSPSADVYSLGAVLAAVVGAEPPVELAAVIGRATAARPADRYPTAAELADDLRRWLDGRRVRAHAYTTSELLWRRVVAWRAPLSVAAVALAVGAVGAAWSWRQTAHERDRAVSAEAAAQDAFAASLRSLALAAWRRGAVAEAEVMAAHAWRLRPEAEAAGLLAGLALEPHPRLVRETPSPPGCERVAVGEVTWCGGAGGLVRHDAAGPTVVEAADVGALVGVGASGVAAVTGDDAGGWTLSLRTSAGAAPVAVDVEAPGRLSPGAAAVAWWHIQAVAALGDGWSLEATACAGERQALAAAVHGEQRSLTAICSDGAIEEHRAGAPVRSQPTALTRAGASPVSAVALDGGDLLVGTARGGVKRVRGDVEVWATEVLVGPVYALATQADFALAASDRGGAVVLQLADGRVRARLPAAQAAGALASGGVWTAGDVVRRWEVPALRPALHTWPAGLSAVAWDGPTLWAAAADGQLVRWTEDGAPRAWRWQQRVMKAVVADPGGGAIGAGLGFGGLGRVDGRGELALFASPAALRRLGALPSGWLWGGAYDPGVPLWRPDRSGWSAVAGMEDCVIGEGWTRGADAVLLDQRGALWWLRDGDPPTARRLFERPAAVAVAIGDEVVLTGEGSTVAAWSVDGTGRWEVDLGSRVLDLAVSPAGDAVAAGLLDGSAALLRAGDGGIVGRLRWHEERVAAVAFAPGAHELATAGWDGQVRRWSLAAPPDAAAVEAAWGLPLDAAMRSP